MSKEERNYKASIAGKKWRLNHRKPCPKCGKPMSWSAEICFECKFGHPLGITQSTEHKKATARKGAKNHPETRREHYLKYRMIGKCQTCGKTIDKYANQCKSCCRKGDKHPSWRGGRHLNNQGYVCILEPSNHHANNRGYVLEHILVWEKAHNQSLPDGWVIHHVNGIKDDNRIENLAGLPDRKHRHILEVKNKRILELESLLKGQPLLI